MPRLVTLRFCLSLSLWSSRTSRLLASSFNYPYQCHPTLMVRPLHITLRALLLCNLSKQTSQKPPDHTFALIQILDVYKKLKQIVHFKQTSKQLTFGWQRVPHTRTVLWRDWQCDLLTMKSRMQLAICSKETQVTSFPKKTHNSPVQ